MQKTATRTRATVQTGTNVLVSSHVVVVVEDEEEVDCLVWMVLGSRAGMATVCLSLLLLPLSRSLALV